MPTSNPDMHLNPLVDVDVDTDLDMDLETASIPDDNVWGASGSSFSEAVAARAARETGETVCVCSCVEVEAAFAH